MDAANKPAIREGNRLVMHPNRGQRGRARDVTAERVEHGLVIIKGGCSGLAEGDVVMLEHPVAEDARYLARSVVETATYKEFSLRIEGPWERIQQRDYVRITTHGITVTFEPEPESEQPGERRRARRRADREEAAPRSYEMLDVSAGGMRFQTRESFESGDALVCSFTLGGELDFTLDASVVRSEPLPEDSSRMGWVACEFEDVDEEDRSRLLQWIYREQVRRHKRRDKRR